MADEQVKSTEEASKNDNVQPTDVSEGASGGTKDDGGEGGKGFFKRFLKAISPAKRSKSVSPKAHRKSKESEDPTQAKSSTSPSPIKKGFKQKLKGRFSKSSVGKDSVEEKVNICEEEVTDNPKMLLAQKEKDMGIASPSPVTESMAAKCVFHHKSSSVSSVPSDYSSLPEDDSDAGVVSPDGHSSFDDEKLKEKKI